MATTVEAGKNPSLWVMLSGRNMRRSLKPMDIGDAIYRQNDLLNPGDIFSIQYWAKIESWILYCKNMEAKNKVLLMRIVSMNNSQHNLTDFLTVNMKHPNGIRVSIHGLPLSVTEEELETWVDSWAVRISAVERAKEKASKAPEGCLIQPIENGNRFCYISRILECIPRYSYYDMSNPLDPAELIQVDITVYVDIPEQTVNCARCMDYSHQYRDCPRGKPSCHICGEIGHMMSRCPQNNTHAFRGSDHPLSNFFSCELSFSGQSFKSSEHLYQWMKASYHEEAGDAERIKSAGTPLEAMRIGDEILVSDTWLSKHRIDAMRVALTTKHSQCLTFRESLERSGDSLLAEATNNKYWATGLGPNRTKTTKHSEWPGENNLGILLMELRDKGFLFEEHTTSDDEGTDEVSGRDDAHPTSTPSVLHNVAIALIDRAIDPNSSSIPSPDLLSHADAILEEHMQTHDTTDRDSVNEEDMPQSSTDPPPTPSGSETPGRSKRKTISPLPHEDNKRSKKKIPKPVKQQHSIKRFLDTFRK